ncbi:MAG: hypothetical protein COA69_08690 [Robiginitomaculum sp.]|nr:MAG: hypothetical protein COA69_08690 [Robiginitomaculum sp.]
MESMKTLGQKRAHECKIKAQAYKLWLQTLWPANIILVTGAALLSLIAGSSLLIKQNILDPRVAGILAIVSAAFTIVHTKLNCDQHQAECRKLKNQYSALANAYDELDVLTGEAEFKTKLTALNMELSQIIKSTTSEPSNKAMAKAKQQLSV